MPAGKGRAPSAPWCACRSSCALAKRNWGDGAYVVKADISKYFASIQHAVLMREAEQVISDRDVLWLWSAC